MTADLELAQDSLQEAYERAWARWGAVSRLDEPEAWVRKVAWRVAVSSHRRRSTFARLMPRLALPDSASTQSGAPGNGPSSASVDAVEESLDVQEALRHLPAEQRRALVLFYLVGMSLAEVASETGANLGTVKSRLHRGRLALLDQLGGTYRVDDGDDVIRSAGRWSS